MWVVAVLSTSTKPSGKIAKLISLASSMALLLVSALALNAYVVVGPAAAPMRATVPSMKMSEAAAKAAWLAKIDQPSWGSKGGARRASGMSTARRLASNPVAAPVPASAFAKVSSTAPRNPVTGTLTRNPALAKVLKKQQKAKKAYEGPEVRVSAFGGPGASSGW